MLWLVARFRLEFRLPINYSLGMLAGSSARGVLVNLIIVFMPSLTMKNMLSFKTHGELAGERMVS